MPIRSAASFAYAGAHRALLLARAFLVDHLADGEAADLAVRVHDVRDTEMVKAFVVVVETSGTVGRDALVQGRLRVESRSARAPVQAGNGDDHEDRENDQQCPAAADEADDKAPLLRRCGGGANGGPG